MLVSVGGSGHTGHAASVAMGEGIGKDRIEFGGYFSHDPLYEGLQCSQRIFWKSAVSLFLFSLSSHFLIIHLFFKVIISFFFFFFYKTDLCLKRPPPTLIHTLVYIS